MTIRHPERDRRACLNSRPEETNMLESLCPRIPIFIHSYIPTFRYTYISTDLYSCHFTFLNPIRAIHSSLSPLIKLCTSRCPLWQKPAKNGATLDNFGSGMDNFGNVLDNFRHPKNPKIRIFSTKNRLSFILNKILRALRVLRGSIFPRLSLFLRGQTKSLRCGRFCAITPFYGMLTHYRRHILC